MAKIIRTAFEYLIGWVVLFAILIIPSYLMSSNGGHTKQPKTPAEWADAHPDKARALALSAKLRTERLAACNTLENPDMIQECLR